MKVLVTGASRGAGRGLAEGLNREGHEVRALVRKPTDATRLREAWKGRKAIAPVVGDVTDFESLRVAFKGMDAFIHAAAAVGEDDSGGNLFQRVNVDGTGNVWRAAKEEGARAGVFISSVAVYGRPNVPEVSEEAPPVKAEVAYEETKRLAEQLAFEMGRVSGIRTTSLRPSVIYGAYDEQFIPRILTGLRARAFVFVGDPDRPINVCSDEHILQCAIAALNEPRADGQAFNVVDGELPTWRQVVTLIAQEAKLPIPTRSVHPTTALRVGTALDAIRKVGLPVGMPSLTRFNARVAGTRCVYRIDKAKSVLGYRPTKRFLVEGPALVRAHLLREAA